MSPARQPSPHRPTGPGITARAAAALCLSLLAGAALLAACGSSGGASSPAATVAAAPTPVPLPLITTGPPPAAAVDAVRQFWTLAGEGRLGEAQRTLVAPGSPMRDWTGEDIAAARFVRLVPGSVSGAPVEGATIEFSVIVWIDAGSPDNPWGDPGDHQLFQHVVRMSDRTWRMYDSGTGP